MIKEIVGKKRRAMKGAIKFPPLELTRDPNFKNYLLKYRVYNFQLRVDLFADLRISFVQGFDKELQLHDFSLIIEVQKNRK